MHVLAPDVPRTAIDAEIRLAASAGHVPARWALPLLEALEPQVSGWARVLLTESEFAALWLPEHAGEPCHGDTARLGDAGGMSLRDAATWLAKHGTGYAAANPSCWGRIIQAAGEPRSTLVVSPVAVGDRLKPTEAALVVVDGLHRALGYWQDGDRVCVAYVPRIREH